ncbi:hypothetical protein [Actinoplanes sp. NPDC049265]|uniref:hypothetical protein n=1 Tax=Actinoplanes sp. NPDC049265 TaxID=3363902 RepID=UPI0037173C75
MPIGNHDQASVAAAGASGDLLSAIAVAVVIMLMGFALQALKNIVGDFWSMLRMMFSALRVAALVSASLALTVAVLVFQLVRH